MRLCIKGRGRYGDMSASEMAGRVSAHKLQQKSMTRICSAKTKNKARGGEGNHHTDASKYKM